MGLDKYIKKRDFSKTKEPSKSKPASKRKSKGELRFVVQRHHASRLHYDFRLEMEGVLKSWAVPKGPSLNPNDKRLAMMVEDHPYDYRTFEGEIPSGHYGGGVVHIFDEGTYEALDKGTEKDLLAGLQAGNLKFELHGKILKGEFALVKIKAAEDNAWLLIKHNDRYAVKKPFDSEKLVTAAVKKEGVAFKETAKKKEKKQRQALDEVADTPVESKKKNNYQPMLATLSDGVFDDPDWIYEKKLDGYRALAYTTAKGKAKLISRNGIDFSNKYQQVIQVLETLGLDAVLDGELVVEDKKGNSFFQELQQYDPEKEGHRLKFYVFDLLALNGHDTRGLELKKRKELLRHVVTELDQEVVVLNAYEFGKGKALYHQAGKKVWEGVIAKDSRSLYTGKRSDTWLKFKFQNSQEAVIIGYLEPGGSRHYFGALALAINERNRLTYIGNCGSGYTEESLRMLYETMQPLITTHKPVKAKVHKEKTVTWVKPELVCEVFYSEWTKDKLLRHPVFKGLRMDKEKEKVVKELPEVKSPDEKEHEKTLSFGRKKVALTNLNKFYWPKEKITKGDLLNYYQEIAEYILPHLKNKPLSLNRHPNGIEQPGFFQKDLDTDQIPSWIKSAPLHSESNNKDIDYLVCNNEATLLWMVNLGCIEINPWLSTYNKPENPLYAVLDLDPHDIDFKKVVKVAQTAKKILDDLKLTAFLKTSGSKGLHIFIPVGKRDDYDITKNFIHYLGELIYNLHPEDTSLERSPAKRKGKIYLDFLQNRRGQTIAAPYSVRPKPGATVSAPLEWEELTPKLDLKDYTLFNMAQRIRKKGELWKELLITGNNLKKALKR